MQTSNNASFKIFDASAYKVGIAVARFNSEITEAALAKAKAKLGEYCVLEQNIYTVFVAGSVELPVVLSALAASEKFDCLVAIGAVVKGETDHYEHVCALARDGILRVMLDYRIPIGFGVLTVRDIGKAKTRIDIGAHAVEAALQAVKSVKEI